MPLIPNKREALAVGLGRLGLVSLFERLARRRRPGLLVLTYHRVVETSAAPYYEPVASATTAGLAAELSALARTHRVVGVEELAGLADRGSRLDAPTALITFDDGYRDNVEAALPVLRALGLPAAFFLPPAFVDADRLPWWDHVAYVLNATAERLVRLDRPEPMTLDLAATPRAEAVARVVRAYLDHQLDDPPGFRAELEDRARVHVDERSLARALFLSWADARALATAGVSVGSHGLTHRPLARLDESDQRTELVESKRRLESELGRPVETLAYPYGWPGTVDALTTRLAREAGYRLAFTSLEGLNRPVGPATSPPFADPLALRRLGVGLADPPAVHRARWALHGAFGGSIL